MGFCRRCGDIVVGPRCKCGGTAVAPVVRWDQNDGKTQDKWSRTYVTKENSPARSARESVDDTLPTSSTSTTTPSKRFPRPASSVSLGSRVSAHIANVTTPRPPSPLKQATSLEDPNAPPSASAAAAGILPNLNPNGSVLAKVYGSVLQPKETLDSFHCSVCSTPFSPDATIYPEPSTLSSTGVVLTANSNTRFLCRSCFIDTGGSKGDCSACHRPVLILKSEGGFVENSGRVWHMKCFQCDGCAKDIGDAPMVDLLGKPCCADCFETCLTRSNRNTPQKSGRKEDEPRNNLGGSRWDREREREGSPALDELEQRLGIVRSRENTPAKHEQPLRMKSPMTASSPRSQLASRSTPGNAGGVDTSPIVDRLAARVRADSFPSLGSSPVTNEISGGRSYNRFKSPEPDTSDVDGSPLSSRRTTRYKSLEPDNDGSPIPRRTYNRFRSPEPDVFGSSPASKTTGSPRYGSPSAASRQPTEDAVEEMKKRFLRQASPAPASASATAASETMTPRRRSRSRARSSVGVVNESGVLKPALTGTPAAIGSGVSRESASRIPRMSEDASLRGSPSVGAQRPQKTGETDYGAPRRNRTEETDLPTLHRERTGEADYMVLRPDRTGRTDYTGLRSHTTGEISYNALRPDRTGQTEFPTLERDRTGDVSVLSSASVRSRKAAEPDYTLRRDRTGEDEVESLLGEKVPTGDLIDLSTDAPDAEPPRARAMGPMSDLPAVLNASRSLGGVGNAGLGIHTSVSRTELNTAYESVPSTPDLGSEFSDTTSPTHSSSAPSTPPSLSPPSRRHSGCGLGSSSGKREATPVMSQTSRTTANTGTRHSRTFDVLNNTPTPKSKTLPSGLNIPSPTPLAPDARCAKCNLPLFTTKHGGKFVTVPEEPSSSGVPPKTYHTACFRCKVCGRLFEERDGGRAVFVRGEDGACHVECAPPEKVKVHRMTSSIPKPSMSNSTTPLSTSRAHNTATYSSSVSSSRYERPPPSAPATTTTFTFPKFGGGVSCPGCNMSVSPMERGVVPGPQGTRWHANCLLCGGKEAKGRRKEEGKPGCGKKLDSAAKTDTEGRVWCRECLLLLPASMRNSSSPARSPVVPSYTGDRGVAPQNTGTTTMARQFTGLGGSDAALMRQFTGGGLSPTRQLSSSPTKLFDGPRPGFGRIYPRPKSVTGIRSTKIDGEGRGMFLVKQLTGGSSVGGREYGV